MLALSLESYWQMVQLWKGLSLSYACLFEVANVTCLNTKLWEFIKIFYRLSRTILLVLRSSEIAWAKKTQATERRRLFDKPWCYSGSWWQWVRWHLSVKSQAHGQVVVGTVVLQSLTSWGEAAMGAELPVTSLKPPKFTAGRTTVLLFRIWSQRFKCVL